MRWVILLVAKRRVAVKEYLAVQTPKQTRSSVIWGSNRLSSFHTDCQLKSLDAMAKNILQKVSGNTNPAWTGSLMVFDDCFGCCSKGVFVKEICPWVVVAFSANVTLDITATLNNWSHRPDSKPASVSIRFSWTLFLPKIVKEVYTLVYRWEVHALKQACRVTDRNQNPKFPTLHGLRVNWTTDIHLLLQKQSFVFLK